MEKKRVYEYAKEHKVSSKTVLDKAKQLGIDYHSHMSTMEDGDNPSLPLLEIRLPSRVHRNPMRHRKSNQQKTKRRLQQEHIKLLIRVI